MSSLACSSRWPFLASGSGRNISLTSRHVLLASTRHCLRATLLLIGRRFFFVSFVLLSSFRWWKKFSGAVSCFVLLSTNISSEFHLANLTGSLSPSLLLRLPLVIRAPIGRPRLSRARFTTL